MVLVICYIIYLYTYNRPLNYMKISPRMIILMGILTNIIVILIANLLSIHIFFIFISACFILYLTYILGSKNTIGVLNMIKEAANWATTSAVIKKMTYAEGSTSDRGTIQYTYMIQMRYDFTIDDTLYQSKAYSIDHLFREKKRWYIKYSDKKKAIEFKNKYKQQSEHLIYYNPADPSQAVINPFKKPKSFYVSRWSPIFAILFLVIGFIVK